jgi:drug/metabolite transporter (DMT)-like permease
METAMRPGRVYAVFCLVCLVFGTTFLAIRIGVASGAPPFLFAGIRFSAAGLALAAALLASRRTSARELAALAPRAALLSVPYIVVNFGATFWAEQYIGSGTAAQIDAVCPIASAALSALFLGKRLRPAHFLGMAAGFGGVWLIVGGAARAAPGVEPGPMPLIASIVMLGAAICFAGSSVLYKRLFPDSVDPFAVNSLNMLFGGLGLIAIAAATGSPAFPLEAGTLLPLAYLIVMGSLVGHSANLWLVKSAGPLFASQWSYVSPVIATAVGALFLGEGVGIAAAAGTAATLAGVALISRAEAAGASSFNRGLLNSRR